MDVAGQSRISDSQEVVTDRQPSGPMGHGSPTDSADDDTATVIRTTWKMEFTALIFVDRVCLRFSSSGMRVLRATWKRINWRKMWLKGALKVRSC